MPIVLRQVGSVCQASAATAGSDAGSYRQVKKRTATGNDYWDINNNEKGTK